MFDSVIALSGHLNTFTDVSHNLRSTPQDESNFRGVLCTCAESAKGSVRAATFVRATSHGATVNMALCSAAPQRWDLSALFVCVYEYFFPYVIHFRMLDGKENTLASVYCLSVLLEGSTREINLADPYYDSQGPGTITTLSFGVPPQTPAVDIYFLIFTIQDVRRRRKYTCCCVLLISGALREYTWNLYDPLSRWTWTPLTLVGRKVSAPQPSSQDRFAATSCLDTSTLNTGLVKVRARLLRLPSGYPDIKKESIFSFEQKNI